eukprot:6098524-Pyramimonas_sp.AAC.1
MRGQLDAAPTNHPCQQIVRGTSWGKVWSRVREAREHCVLFFDRGGGGVSLLPAARRATIPYKNLYQMHIAAKSGSCTAAPRSLPSGGV